MTTLIGRPLNAVFNISKIKVDSDLTYATQFEFALKIFIESDKRPALEFLNDNFIIETSRYSGEPMWIECVYSRLGSEDMSPDRYHKQEGAIFMKIGPVKSGIECKDGRTRFYRPALMQVMPKVKLNEWGKTHMIAELCELSDEQPTSSGIISLKRVLDDEYAQEDLVNAVNILLKIISP